MRQILPRPRADVASSTDGGLHFARSALDCGGASRRFQKTFPKPKPNFYRRESANLISRRSRFGVRWRQPPLSNTFGDSKTRGSRTPLRDTTRDPKRWLAPPHSKALRREIVATARKISTPEPASGYTSQNRPPLSNTFGDSKPEVHELHHAIRLDIRKRWLAPPHSKALRAKSWLLLRERSPHLSWRLATPARTRHRFQTRPVTANRSSRTPRCDTTRDPKRWLGPPHSKALRAKSWLLLRERSPHRSRRRYTSQNQPPLSNTFGDTKPEVHEFHHAIRHEIQSGGWGHRTPKRFARNRGY